MVSRFLRKTEGRIEITGSVHYSQRPRAVTSGPRLNVKQYSQLEGNQKQPDFYHSLLARHAVANYMDPVPALQQIEASL